MYALTLNNSNLQGIWKKGSSYRELEESTAVDGSKGKKTVLLHSKHKKSHLIVENVNK